MSGEAPHCVLMRRLRWDSVSVTAFVSLSRVSHLPGKHYNVQRITSETKAELGLVPHLIWACELQARPFLKQLQSRQKKIVCDKWRVQLLVKCDNSYTLETGFVYIDVYRYIKLCSPWHSLFNALLSNCERKNWQKPVTLIMALTWNYLFFLQADALFVFGKWTSRLCPYKKKFCKTVLLNLWRVCIYIY